MAQYNFDNFQIPHTGVVETELATQVRTDTGDKIRRSVSMKMSNFGASKVGDMMSSDYTRIVLSFANKDNSSDWSSIVPVWQFAEKNENPLLVGETLKYTRDDQFIRMGMSKDSGASIDLPGFDVMDTNLVDAEAMVAFDDAYLMNWPTEGFRTFGGKYDFPYEG